MGVDVQHFFWLDSGENSIMLFVDLKKGCDYDYVPRQELWKILDKCRVPQRMLSIVRPFHEILRSTWMLSVEWVLLKH